MSKDHIGGTKKEIVLLEYLGKFQKKGIFNLGHEGWCKKFCSRQNFCVCKGRESHSSVFVKWYVSMV